MPKPVLLTFDDDPEVLRSVARDLRRNYGKEYRILRAESGQAGLETLVHLKEQDDPVALVISDQRMPQMDGVTFLKNARETFPEMKRVLLTAYADTEAAIGAINDSQVDYYLLKPWDPPEEKLFPVLDDLLSDWQASHIPAFEGIRVIGDRWASQVHEIKDFLATNQVPYQFIDVESSEDMVAIATRNDGQQLPRIILPSGKTMDAPTTAELAGEIGLQTKAKADFYDLSIVGGGPAGLASAVYGGSEGLKTVLIEEKAPGGQAGTSSRIENYLGFPVGLSGSDLARRAVAQARRFNVEILTPQHATSLAIDGPYKVLTLADGSEIVSHLLTISTGVAWRRLPMPGAEKFTGAGIYYGAAMSEAMNCKGHEVFTVGAGNSAGQAAMYFSQYASKVIMLVRGSSLEAKMSQYLVDRISHVENIEVRLNTEIESCHGSERLEGVSLRNGSNGETEEVAAEFVFSFIGARPPTDWLKGVLALDKYGFVLTGPDLKVHDHLQNWPLERLPYHLECSVPGVFAAGDVRHDSIKRVASAVGEGSVAVAFMHRYLATL